MLAICGRKILVAVLVQIVEAERQVLILDRARTIKDSAERILIKATLTAANHLIY